MRETQHFPRPPFTDGLTFQADMLKPVPNVADRATHLDSYTESRGADKQKAKKVVLR